MKNVILTACAGTVRPHEHETPPPTFVHLYTPAAPHTSPSLNYRGAYTHNISEQAYYTAGTKKIIFFSRFFLYIFNDIIIHFA